MLVIHRLNLILPVVLAIAALALFASATAQQTTAAGKASTSTEHLHKQHIVDFDYGFLCEGTGPPERHTLDITGVFHVTELADDRIHVTGTFTGMFVGEQIDSALQPVDPTDPDSELVPVDPGWAVIPGATTYSGRFTQSFEFNSNARNETSTSTARVNVRGSDGSTIKTNEVFRFSTNASGDVTVDFGKLNCR